MQLQRERQPVTCQELDSVSLAEKWTACLLQAMDELRQAGLDTEGVELLKKLYDEVRALQDREREEQRIQTNQVRCKICSRHCLFSLAALCRQLQAAALVSR